MVYRANAVGSIVVAACLSACGQHAPDARRASVAPAAAPTAAVACTLDERDVALEHFLFAEAPEPDPESSYPFARVNRAAHVKMELPTGVANFVTLNLETTMVRLHAFARAEDAVLYPAYASIFGELVVPLATNRLRWRGGVHDRLSLDVNRQPLAEVSLPTEWRDCSYLKLKAPAPFAVADQLGLVRNGRVKFPSGGHGLYTSPEASGHHVTLYLSGDEDLWILEEKGRWVRILRETETTAFVGWIDRSGPRGGTLGYGARARSRPTKPCAIPTTTCASDLPLFANVNGHIVEVGVAKGGASVALGTPSGEYTQMRICDPEVDFMEPPLVRTAQAAVCQ